MKATAINFYELEAECVSNYRHTPVHVSLAMVMARCSLASRSLEAGEHCSDCVLVGAHEAAQVNIRRLVAANE